MRRFNRFAPPGSPLPPGVHAPQGVGTPGNRGFQRRMLGDYPVPPTPANWDVNRIKGLATQAFAPATGVEQSQGSAYDVQPGVQEALQRPRDPGINVKGWVNPYTLTFYTFAVSTTTPLTALPGNKRRAYLIIQNQGPGNLFVNFGQDASAATATIPSNGLQLVQTQVYEIIGGGDVDPYENPRANCFVPGNYVSLISDLANTFALIGEGTWHFPSATN